MGAEIDRLEVQVEAQATKANNQLDIMVQRLDRVASSLTKINSGGLTGLANGVSRFAQASSQLSNVKKTDFNRLVKSVERLYDLDVQKMYSASSAITSMSKAVSGLGTVFTAIGTISGSKVDKAIAKLPALADALSQFMTVMSKAPKVSQNVIYMTDALASLAAQGGKVGTAAKTTAKALDIQSASAEKAAKRTRSLSVFLSRLYQAYFMVKRVASQLYKFTETSMDFLETVNYFEVAMRDIGDGAAAQWKENGYASAEAYAESFSERAKQLTAKMTGYSIDKDGNASYTGMKNLGMDPDKVLQYQATYAQISSSMGVAEESALNFSKALTMLGADWASLRNLTFEQGWEKFASALAGQSRAVRSLGIDITNATLQEYAYKNGLEQAVSEMNQATKAQLRLLAILDQSKVAYGDLANTIESPSNQIRMFQQNVSNLGRVIGNLFLPILQKTLPWINGMAIALQRMFTWIGNMLGIKFDSINSSMGGMSDEMYDLVDGADDLADGIGAADKAAKKLNKTLQGWHEINNITTNDSGSGSGAGISGGNPLLDSAIADALGDYEKVWNEAFERMENKAQMFAEKIGKKLEPLKKIMKDLMVGDFYAAGKDTSDLVAGIFNFFADAIDKVDWFKLGQNMGAFIAGIDWLKILKSVVNVFGEALKAAFELWLGTLSKAPLETALASIFLMPKALKAIAAGKYVTGISKLASKFGTLAKNGKAFMASIKNKGVLSTFSAGIKAFRDNLTGAQKGVIGVTAVLGEFFVLKDGFYDLTKGTDNMVASLAEIAVGAGVASAALYAAFGPAGLVVAGITGVAAAIMGINKAMDEIRAEEIGASIKDALSNPGGTPLSEVTSMFADSMGAIGDKFSIVSEKAAGLQQADQHIRNTWLEIEKIKTSMDAGVISVDEGTAKLKDLFSELSQTAVEKFGILEDTLLAAFGENGVLRDTYERMGVSVEGFTSTIIQLNDKAKDRVEELRNLMSNPDISTEDYVRYKEEFDALSGSVGELTGVMNNYSLALSQIDYSDLILPDGALDTVALEGFLKQVSSAAESANNDIQDAISDIQTSLTNALDMANNLGDRHAAEEIQAQLDTLPQALSLLKADVAAKAAELTDTIQIDFIQKTNDIINSAKDDWNSKSAAEQWFSGIFGPGTEAEYVKEAVDRQQKNIESLSGAIEAELNNLKIDGAGWADDAMSAIYAQIFSFNHMGAQTSVTLKKDFESVIDNATSGLYEIAASRGKDLDDGYANGITNNSSVGTDAAKSFTEKVLETIANVQDSHSPSKVTEEYGKYAVEGYSIGMGKNTKNTLDVVNNYMGHVLNAFATLPASLMVIGQQASQSLIDGIESLEGVLYNKINKIVENITKELNGAFEINGAPTGITIGKIPTYSTGGYPEDGLFMANHGELVGQFANGKTAVANNDQITAGIEEAAYRGVSRALAESGGNHATFEVEGDPNGIFKVVKKEARDYTKRTGKPAFG